MTTGDNLSSAALAVALVALITTISQLLGQFFATADGYRRCQSSVMGGWAKKTHRRFRWSELRFETLYSTPRFGLTGNTRYLDIDTGTASYLMLNGLPESMQLTFCKPSRFIRDEFNELVSWVRLLEALHKNTLATTTLFGPPNMPIYPGAMFYSEPEDQRYSMPDVRVQKRSWDFMPPDVVRPLADVTVSDIAVLARRLGMVWKQFDVSEGNMRAEGNGHFISSTMSRSIGTILQISISDQLLLQDLTGEKSTSKRDELYIPSEEADKMGFGIVSGERGLDIPDYKIGTEEEIYEMLRSQVRSREAADTVKSICSANTGWTPAAPDIIGFASPMMRRHGSSLIRVPQPSGYAVGFTEQQEGFVVFHRRLRDLIAERDDRNEPVSPQTRAVLKQYEELKERYVDQWEDQHTCNRHVNDRSITFLDELHKRHDDTSEYFKHLQTQYAENGGKGSIFRYTDLMHAHIKHAVNYFQDSMDRLKASPSRARDHYGMRVAGWITEGAHIYFDNIEKVTITMRDQGFDEPEVVEEAWLTMMFRAFLWHRCHYMVEAPRVPSRHWGSRLPVYIG